MQTHKTEKQSRHRQHSKGMAKQGTEKVNQTLSYPKKMRHKQGIEKIEETCLHS